MKKLTIFFLVVMVAFGAAGAFLVGRYREARPSGLLSGPGIVMPQRAEMHEARVDVAKPAATPVTETIRFGAGRLTLASADQDLLISGTARYRAESQKPIISSEGDSVTLRSGGDGLSLPFPGRGRIGSEWNLVLARGIPTNLDLEAGAVDSRIDLGGLDLRTVRIRQGAANLRLSVSSPLAGNLDSFDFEGGASDSRIDGLGNTGARNLHLKSSAGNFELDFSGSKPGAMDVRIESGVGNLTVIVPRGRAATLVPTVGVSSVSSHGSWSKNGDTYSTGGKGDPITIRLSLGAGNVELRN
jgi:hypothetical protein